MIFVFSFVLIFKTGDNEVSFEKKMPCGGGGMLCGGLQPGWQRSKTLSLRSNVYMNSPQKKMADDKSETHTIKKMFKFKLVNTNVQSQINMQESARLSMYLVCLEIDYFE